jgi:hypothetical protein
MLPRMDERALIRAAYITLRRVILETFPAGPERRAWLRWARSRADDPPLLRSANNLPARGTMQPKNTLAVSCVSLLCLLALMLLDGAAVTAANVSSQDGTTSTSLPKAVSVNTNVLDDYVGHYQLAPTAVLTVTDKATSFSHSRRDNQRRKSFPRAIQNFLQGRRCSDLFQT